MDTDTLSEIGRALYGDRWQSPLARDLGVAVRTVQRWAEGTRGIPGGLPADLRPLLADRRDLIDRLIHRL